MKSTMNRVKYSNMRTAIAMIELIFAIVIMGIAIMSAPTLISQAKKSGFVTIQQESIATLAAHTSSLLTYAWDEQDENTTNILDTNDITDAWGVFLERNATSAISRGGVGAWAVDPIHKSNRVRRYRPAILQASTFLGQDGVFGTPEIDDDIDDFIANPLTLTPYSTIINRADQGEMIDKNISIKTDVSYALFQNNALNLAAGTVDLVYPPPKPPVSPTVADTSNIKIVTTTLTSTSPAQELASKVIIMQSFMCNIGQNQPQGSWF